LFVSITYEDAAGIGFSEVKIFEFEMHQFDELHPDLIFFQYFRDSN